VKCISLWQPWAQLVVLGLKRWETRSWRTEHRGPLLIHAASRRLPRYEPGNVEGARVEFLFTRLEMAGHRRHALPRGAVVGLVVLQSCRRTQTMAAELWAAGDPLERLAGDFTGGRWAWELSGAVRLSRPWPMRGRQGLFDVEIPEGHHDLVEGAGHVECPRCHYALALEGAAGAFCPACGAERMESVP
jgi:hypothetical protein